MGNHVTQSESTRLYRARGFKELIPAVGSALGDLLGVDPAQTRVSLIFPSPKVSGFGLLFNERTLADDRRFLVAEMGPALTELLYGPRGAILSSAPLGEVIGLAGGEGFLPPDETAPTLIAWAQSPEGGTSVMLAPLTENFPEPDPSLLEKLGLLAEELAQAASPLVCTEFLRREVEQMTLVHESMHRALVAPEEAQLFDQLGEVLKGRFGFGRSLISLLNSGASAFYAEYQTGFEPGFEAPTFPVDRRDNLFARALESGEVCYLVDEENVPPELQPFAEGGSIRRAVIAPLRIGSRAIGFVYADRARSDDFFLFRRVFESFVPLAAAAIENLTRRTSAEHRAETDSLTGAYNRYFLDRVLEIEIPRVKRYGNPISMLMIDLCDFKQTNDTYGHIFGDHILRETVALIQANVRAPDIVVRYGGDEFVILMVNTTHEHAKRVKERIESAFIERNRTQEAERMMIDISVGLRSADANTITTLLEDADRAMYGHKTERNKRVLVEALFGLPTARTESIHSVVSSLLSNLNKREPFYQEHCRRVAFLCLVMMKELELRSSEVRTILLGALLHDVGKASLPTEILQRPGPLSDAEMRAVQAHPQMGEEFFKGLAHLEEARAIIRHHHERYDGKRTGEFPGYPLGLMGEAIPFGARILKLADSTDAMLTERPYRKARPLAGVIEELKKESGGSFDPQLVEVLLRSTQWSEEIGSSEALAALYETVIRAAEEGEAEEPPTEEVAEPA